MNDICDICGEIKEPIQAIFYGMNGNVCIDCLEQAINLDNAIGFETERVEYFYKDFNYMGYWLDDIRQLINADLKERERLNDPKLKNDIKRVCLGIDKDEFADYLLEL